MAVFYCSACDKALTGELNQWVERLKADDDHERDAVTRRAVPTVPQGFFAIDPEPWGAPFVVRDDPDEAGSFQSRCGSWFTDEGFMRSDGPRDTVLLHPDDIANLTPIREACDGCCGPIGWSGPNLACGCGAAVATVAANCGGPYEAHFDPSATYASSVSVPQRGTATDPTICDSD